jgi:hypothetical protein
MTYRLGSTLVFALSFCALGHAQTGTFEVQAGGGWATFPDEGAINHGLAGGSFHAFLARGFFIGGESFYWVGPGEDRDVTIFPFAGYEFRRSSSRVRPYVIGGVGWLYHRERTGTGIFWGRGHTYGGGVGFKIPITDRLYIAPEARLGWEPALRATLGLGYRF